MSDNIKRFNAIRKALTKYYPKSPTKRQNRHLTTLAALISGIVGAKSTQLPQIATKAPDRAKPESRVKRYSRLLQNENVTETAYFMPFAQDLVEALAQRGTLAVGAPADMLLLSANPLESLANAQSIQLPALRIHLGLASE